MRVNQSALLVAAVFWCGFGLLVWRGPETDPWVRAVEWTIVAALSAAVLWSWRPGQAPSLPPTIARWLSGESGGKPQHRR